MKDKGDNSAVLGIAELYDDRNFKDTKLICYLTCGLSAVFPKLSTIGFNDKASSIKVYNEMKPSIEYAITYQNLPNKVIRKGNTLRPVLACFHNTGFSGAVIYCIAPPTGSSDIHADYNLKTIGWNDRISSIGWVLVSDLSILEGDNPQFPAHKDC